MFDSAQIVTHKLAYVNIIQIRLLQNIVTNLLYLDFDATSKSDNIISRTSLKFWSGADAIL